MPNSRQYRYFHKGENEWLSEPHPNDSEEDQKAWDLEWESIKQESEGMKVEFSEDMYLSSEYGEMPDWVNVTIKDDYILEYKLARGIVKSLQGAQSIVYHLGIDCYVSDDFGSIGHEQIAITDHGAYVTIRGKHSSEELEVDVSEQFNQAIGETA